MPESEYGVAGEPRHDSMLAAHSHYEALHGEKVVVKSTQT